ncbi:MAG: malonyl CoA-acyl carrier protein transacylase, partial [Pseudomonadota bacterium]
TGMVRWRESMQFLADNGVAKIYEAGAGRVLTGMARRLEGVDAQSIGTPEEVESSAAELNG